MKKFRAISFCLLLVPCCVQAQKDRPEELFYLWKKDWVATTNKEEAAFFSRLYQVNDTCWQMDTYNYAGPMLFAERYRDKKTSIRHGVQYYYHPSGYIDSSGNVLNGLPEGDWVYCDDAGHVILRKSYRSGALVSKTDPGSIIDSTGQVYDDNEKEAEFPGGLKAWQKYLHNHMSYPQRAQDLKVTGWVDVEFVVDEHGRAHDANICKSVEYSLDEEALSLIRHSPKWIPSTKNNIPVPAYKRQPMQFSVAPGL